jgi:RNA polymerase sigma-70 factor (ECF subfamily)
LSLSPSAVKMRLMRARERFITLYKQETGRQ